ncbi:MAG: helix-turn-helix domain-containing protein [Pirellulales bacterium]|nr:helix-turn-helix domain-containing protein [Pirellulales bacterium]
MSNVCQSLVARGFEVTLEGKKRDMPPRAKLLDGEQEAKIIALRLGEPPAGYSNWSLRLVAEKTVELGIVESISHTTVGTTLMPFPVIEFRDFFKKKTGITRSGLAPSFIVL